MIDEQFSCPRRTLAGNDKWRDDKTCAYCGSLHPNEFLEHVIAGAEVTPTDKNYKVYLETREGPRKFYFQHFSIDQKKQFIDLCNDGRVNIAYPGYFYVLPYFCKVER